MQTNKVGRPPVTDEARQHNRCVLRFTDREYEIIKAKAKEEGCPLATYVKRIVLSSTKL